MGSAAASMRGSPASSAQPAAESTGRKLLEHICRGTTLPPMPTVIVEVLQAMRRKNADLQKIAGIIAKDPALVTRVLQAVNSSYYGLRHRMASVAQALPLLGLKNLRILVAGHSVVPAMKKCGPASAVQMDCCRRSLYCGTAARLLAERVGIAAADECFLAALLMDIGVLAMAEVIGAPYVQMLGAADRHTDLELMEREKYQFSHAVVSAVLTRQWRLPEDLAVPIQFHHNPAGASADMVAQTTARIIRLAGFCADVFLEHNPLWPIAEAYRLATDDFGLDKLAMDQLMEELATETRKLGAAFEVQVDEGATLARAHRRVTDELGQMLREQGELPSRDELQAMEKASPNGPGQPAPTRRREARAPQSGSVTVFPCEGTTFGYPVRAAVRDVSVSGIGLQFEEAMDAGSEFIIGLRRGEQKATVILYQTRHCTPAEGGDGFLVGAHLVRALREQDLLAESSSDTALHRLGRTLIASAPSRVR